MKNICVTSVGIGGRYGQCVQELKKSLDRLGVDSNIYINQYPENSPPHSQVPYGFKYYAIKNTIEKGYDKILWMDSICTLLKEPTIIDKILDTDGYFFPPDGWWTGQWCSDNALRILDIDREECFKVPMLAAKHLGFNMKYENCKKVLEEFKRYLDIEDALAFKGSWTNKNHEVSSDSRVTGHRHDQTVLSVIAYRLNMELKSVYNDYIAWGNPTTDKQIIRVG